MKDEAKVLQRMLSSVNSLVDECVCVDTGSSDSSKQIIKEFFEKQNKPCKIYDHPFIDFEDARNFALEKLKGKDGIGFWIDCDEQIVLNDKFDLNKFKEELSNCDLGTTLVTSGESKFARRNFFKISKPFRWEGKVHEILLCDEEIKIINFTELEILVNHDGNSWSEGIQKKYLKHAEILQREVDKTNKPRDLFYLAQSYKDGGDYENAIKWYRKRVEMINGFYEERYYSQFMIGILYQNTNKPYQETFFEYMKCSSLDSNRAEHILNAIIILLHEGLYDLAICMSNDAVLRFHERNPYPKSLLFIDAETYSKKLLDVHYTLISIKN